MHNDQDGRIQRRSKVSVIAVLGEGGEQSAGAFDQQQICIGIKGFQQHRLGEGLALDICCENWCERSGIAITADVIQRFTRYLR